MPHSWNLSEWLDVLGLRRADQPDVIHGIQPVEIIGDHSGFSAQILPPMAWMGGTRAGVAGAKSILSLTSRAAGGTYVRLLNVTVEAATNIRWRITTSPYTYLNAVANLVKSEMGSSATVSSIILATTVSTVATTTVPTSEFASTAEKLFHDFAYIPTGSTLELWNATNQQGLYIACMFEDCPAQPSAQ